MSDQPIDENEVPSGHNAEFEGEDIEDGDDEWFRLASEIVANSPEEKEEKEVKTEYVNVDFSIDSGTTWVSIARKASGRLIWKKRSDQSP